MIAVSVAEQSQVAEARRRCVELAHNAGFGETAAGRVALVVTEMATNLIKHGRGGHLLADLSDWAESAGTDPADLPQLELIAIDQGPGIANLATALQDGFSTAGSAGHGLGAIRRQAQAFGIYSSPGAGTAILARVSAETGRSRSFAAATPALGRVGAVSIAKSGESVCGDSWHVQPGPGGRDGRRTMMVADGLGHGPQAAEASSEAVRIFKRHAGRAPAEIMEFLHAGLRGTRGAAISIAQFDASRRVVAFCGVGNVGGAAVSRGAPVIRRMVTVNGTVGHVLRKVQQFEYPYPDGGSPAVILCSDGISSHWSLDKYPGLLASSPALVAAALYRDFGRDRDDATVLVAHDPQEEG